jgi:hypothetical protein
MFSRPANIFAGGDVDWRSQGSAGRTYPYFTWFSRRMLTSWRLNPHCGAEGVPFMKSMTGLLRAIVSPTSRHLPSLVAR